MKAKKTIQEIKPYPVPLFEEEGFLKLDSNENDFGPSPLVLQALKNVDVSDVQYYPYYGKLLQKLADFHNVGIENVILTAGADEAIVVTTPEVSAVRDADRIIGLLEASEIHNPKLIINRLKIDMVQRGDMMNIDDILDILAIDLIGVVPDDENIVISTNRGEPAVTNQKSLAGQAYRNISKRIQGEEIPFIDLNLNEGFMSKLKKLIGLK